MNDNEESANLPAPIQGQGDISFRMDSSHYIDTIPEDHPQRKAWVYAALLDGVHTTADSVGKTITVCYVVGSVGEYPEEQSGEIKRRRRIVLIDDKGNMVSTTSEVIWKSLLIESSFSGPPPWLPGRKFKIVRPAGKRYLTLVPVATKD